MDNQTTKELKTLSGHVLVLRSYLTARDALPVLGDEKLSSQQKSHKLAVASIVSFDGSAEDIENRVLDLPLPDYTFLLNNLKEIMDGGFPQAK